MPNICNGIEKMSLFSNKCSILGLSQQCRHTASGHAHALKTKKAVSKRFIRTGKGGLKGGKAYHGHLTSHKSGDRMRRLNVKAHLVGAALKKMNTLILTGK